MTKTLAAAALIGFIGTGIRHAQTATTGSLIIGSRAIVDTLGLSPERPNDREAFALRA